MLNLGWLYLQVKTEWNEFDKINEKLNEFGVPEYIRNRLCVISDKLFTHVVNSNLEVRTSVAINPVTGTAEEGALFTYEALPRGTVFIWEVTCRNPKHFKINSDEITAVNTPDDVRNVLTGDNSGLNQSPYDYLEYLGIGGMGSRGMGRLRVLNKQNPIEKSGKRKEVSQ